MHGLNEIIFVLYIGLMMFVGMWRSGQVRTQNQFLLANRNIKFFALIATLVMTELNTSTLIAFSAVGYTASWWGLSLPLVFLIGLIFYALSVATRWKQWNGTSVATYFTQRYGADVGLLAAIILFVAMLGFTSTYVKSVTLIFMPLFPQLSSGALSAVLVICIVGITLRGGLVSVIRTDIISFVIVLLLFPALLFFVSRSPVVTPFLPSLSFHEMQQLLPFRFVVSLILLTMFSYILAPWYGQKIVAAHSSKTAFWAVVCASILIFILYEIK